MDGGGPTEFLFEEETFRIRGAAFEVYRRMGAGFLEAVYQDCLAREFLLRGIDFRQRQPLHLEYRGEPLRQAYVADFVCCERIILELKAVRSLAPEHRAQTINYLKATGLRLGLLLNFGSVPRMQVERFAL